MRAGMGAWSWTSGRLARRRVARSKFTGWSLARAVSLFVGGIFVTLANLELRSWCEVIDFAEDGRRGVEIVAVAYFNEAGEAIARLRLELCGEVYGLWVHKNFRRQGLATALWVNAPELTGIVPRHSEWRTDDGDAFARSFGVPLPARLNA